MGEPRRAANREPVGRPYLSEGEAVMEEFTLGARASCPDGFCGVVSGTMVDPAARTVTHLVIEPEAEKVLVVDRAVPMGETEVYRRQSVHAVDGEIGQVEGFMVNPADEKVTHVLLEEGHLWGRKQVAIPVSAVASIDDGIRLNITKRQVEDLPPVGQPG
jgi:sporulation protein YlmC with PRC-barrel domain